MREPRRKGARVAAPSGCIVPWAARVSCWPQPQQLLPVSAAGSGRRCCCSNPPLRPFCTADKTETPVPGSDTGVLGGRGWIARAAQKRSPGRGSQRLHRALGGTRILLAAAPTAPPCFCRWQRSSLLHRGFFTRRTVRRVDAVRIHPLYESSLVTKQKPQRICIR